MKTVPTRLLIPSLLLLVAGCGSGSEKDAAASRPPELPSLEHPVVFNLDMSTPLPLLTVLTSREEIARLREKYSSFLAEMGPPQRGGFILSLRYDKKGSLVSPWNFYLSHFARPYPVRRLGILPDGKKEVIHEETY
jgi:hypothetical protein